MTIHFAATIYTSSAWVYIGACGYTGTDPHEFSNEHGVVLKRRGGCVTCPECIKRIEGTHD